VHTASNRRTRSGGIFSEANHLVHALGRQEVVGDFEPAQHGKAIDPRSALVPIVVEKGDVLWAQSRVVRSSRNGAALLLAEIPAALRLVIGDGEQ